jgi:hypothetical protein
MGKIAPLPPFTMALKLQPRFSTTSTALLISAVTLPVSVIAFAVLYANNDSFLSRLWLAIILPTIWLLAGVLSIIDAVKRHSWKQIAGVVVLLGPTVFLVNTALSPRFAFHQLFTFRPLDLHLPSNGFVLMKKFEVCAEGQSCKPDHVATTTLTFHVKKMPVGCCSLAVINGHDGNKVDSFRVVLNGKEVRLEAQKAAVYLNADNEISVQLTGSPESYVYIVVSYTGKKDAPLT